MDAVIVIQGYEGGGDPELRIKEVAIVGLCRSFIGHWIIERPSQFPNRESFERVVTPIQDKDYHKIFWHEGSVSLEKLKREIIRLDFKEYRLYAPDEKYKIFIENLTGIPPVALQDYEVPRLSSLFDGYADLRYCVVHSQKGAEEDNSICALKTASAYRKWIRQNCSPGKNIFFGDETYGEVLYENLQKRFKKLAPSARVATNPSFSPGSRDEVG